MMTSNWIRTFYFVIVLVNLNYQEMDYKVLDWKAANDIKNNMNAKLFMHLQFNLSTIYLLKDSSYLLMPLNPFGNSLLTANKPLLDDWITQQHFPSRDKANKFYFEKQKEIENLIEYKETLKEDLCNYVFKGEKKYSNKLSAAEIDNIFYILKKRKKFEEYKLNFIVLAGDHIINQNRKENYKWALLKNKQLLNPIMTLVIVTDEKTCKYFNIEDGVTGKYGYFSMDYLLNQVTSHVKSSNNIEEVDKVM